MAKAKKAQINQPVKASSIDPKNNIHKSSVPASTEINLRINLAIGTITLIVSILLLYALNKVILSYYNPDVSAILNKVLPLTFQNPATFIPEPVERLQFQLSLLCTPLFIFIVFKLLNKKRTFFFTNPTLSFYINIIGILLLLCYILAVLKQDLLYIPDETTKYFFANNVISRLNPLLVIILYSLFIFLFFLYNKSRETIPKKMIVNIISYVIAAFVIIDIILYNVFHLAFQEWGRFMETNAVFYSITQVYAGKSLLVNINSQYGLYAWVLCPLFKLIGLSTFKFGIVMAILNGISFSLFFLGIKRLIRQDVLSIITFLVLVWWLYWQNRLPHESTPRFYYQYAPLRVLFPSLSFFLIVFYQTCRIQLKKVILPIMALVAAIGVLWNLDTGLVLFGATTIALIYSAFNTLSPKDAIKRSLIYCIWMGGALLFIITVFSLSTKVHSGFWPDFGKFAAFQNIFYVSGFFMLPMSAMHFWNLPVIIYLITGIYCVYQLGKKLQPDTPVIVFLFILGAGIFAYFQGRSYDTNLDLVIYPAIILLGILCNKLMPYLPFNKGQFKFHECYVLFLIIFLFLADSAFSMLYSSWSINSFAMGNAFTYNKAAEDTLKQRIDFLKNNLHQQDTVIILAQDYESYYYAAGNYYNPVNLPGSTELFFKSEIGTLLNTIKTTKYPIIYDAKHVSVYNDTLVKTLAKYTHIENAIPDKTLLLLKRSGSERIQRLVHDNKTAYYNNTGEFNSYFNPTTKLDKIPDTFSIEFFANLDTTRLRKDNVIFSNVSATKQYCGFLMVQYGSDLNQYMFTYGNGKAWCNGVVCRLSCTTENHVLIKVDKNMITVYDNNKSCGMANTNSSIAESEGLFFINTKFAGTVEEMKISY